jgi:hypothetical protein
VETTALVAIRDEPADARTPQRSYRFGGSGARLSRPIGILIILTECVDGGRQTHAEDGDDGQRGQPRAHLTLIVRVANADVEMVVVVPEHSHDSGRPPQLGVGPDIDDIRARGDEQVDERLGERPVDLRGVLRRALSPVQTRVVHVRVEAVLMRCMLRSEGPAPPAAEIADADARRFGVSARVSLDDAEHGADEIVRAPPAPGAVRRDVQDRIPGEELLPSGWEPYAALEPPRSR